METVFSKAVIIDDEPDGRNIIALLLRQFFPNIQQLGEAGNVAEAIGMIRELEPDLIFLDVEMPDGYAFDLLSSLNGLQAQVILVTAHNQYAIKAIKASVSDYLLKPVNREEFIMAVNKALLRKKPETNSEMLALLKNMNQYMVVRKVRIPTMEGFTLVDIDTIVRCEASGNYTIVVFTDHTQVVASRTLGSYEEELTGYGFVRIHHKHLVNINRIIEYAKGSKGGGYITLHGRKVLEVSARRKGELLAALNNRY